MEFTLYDKLLNKAVATALRGMAENIALLADEVEAMREPLSQTVLRDTDKLRNLTSHPKFQAKEVTFTTPPVFSEEETIPTITRKQADIMSNHELERFLKRGGIVSDS